MNDVVWTIHQQESQFFERKNYYYRVLAKYFGWGDEKLVSAIK